MKSSKQAVRLLVSAWVGACLLFPLTRFAYGETNVQILHNPVFCAVAEKPLRMTANILSNASLQEVRLYFRQQGVEPFYFIEMKPAAGNLYAGMLPAPVKTGQSIEYLILVVAGNNTVLRSPPFFVSIQNAATCLEAPGGNASGEIVVYAEQAAPPENGFTGKNVRWAVAQDTGTPYLMAAREIQVQSQTASAPVQANETEISPKSGFSLKNTLLLGAGLGAAGAGALLLAGKTSSDNGVAWTIPEGTVAENVVAELQKVPEVETSCGTVVANRLYVTNNRADVLTVGTIDYEIVLTQDNPAKSCEPGRNGTFAPNLAVDVKPGETALIREWSNEVNPCSDCPYSIAHCQWRSRYIVHTSAGNGVAEATFTVEGKTLCSTPSAKSSGKGRMLKGDLEP